MLNKYAVAVSSKETPWIETVSATSIKDAEDKLIIKFTEQYDLSNATDWDTFLDVAWDEAELLFGEIEDIEIL